MNSDDVTLTRSNDTLHISTPEETMPMSAGATVAGMTCLVADVAAGIAALDDDERFLILRVAQEPMALPKPDWSILQQYRGDWDAEQLQAIFDAHKDVLGEAVLADGEPDLASVRAQMPVLKDYAFVSHPAVAQPAVVHRDGTVEGLWEEPLAESIETVEMAACPAPVPVIMHSAPEREQITFMEPDESGEAAVWIMRHSEGKMECYCCGPDGEGVSPAEFFEALRRLLQQPADDFGIRVPDKELAEAAVRSLGLGLATQTGPRPRYGVGPYDQEIHHSFPPTTISTIEALLAVGRPQQALQSLQYYIDRYVQRDGTFDYYGPSVAEYGQFLALAALVGRQTGMEQFARRNLALLSPIWQRLLQIRKKSKTDYEASDPRHGLIPGLPEADYHADEEQWEEFYYCGDLWVCRGLREMGRALAECGPSWSSSIGRSLLAQADAYRDDILASLKTVGAFDGEYVPPGPMQTDPIETMTADRHTSYCNYRYFPEMLSAGILPEELAGKILHWRRDHGGELLGMTRFKDHLDDWPVAHVARGLLELGMIDRYLLLMYSHLAHHQDPLTLAAYEQVSIETTDGVRHNTAGQVVPCQMTVPTMLGWALAYPERESDKIHLTAGVPASWWRQKGRIQGPPVYVQEDRAIHWHIEIEGNRAVLYAKGNHSRPIPICWHLHGMHIAACDISGDETGTGVEISENCLRFSLPPGASVVSGRYENYE